MDEDREGVVIQFLPSKRRKEFLIAWDRDEETSYLGRVIREGDPDWLPPAA